MKQRTKDISRQLAGYGVGIACLIWVFHDIHGERLLSQIAGINWWLVGIAVFLDICSYATQGLRWTFLLRPLGRLGMVRATQAVYAGLFVNEIMPLRAGEVVRTYLVSRWLSTGFVSVVPSIAVERVLDGVCLFAGIGLTALFVRLPVDLMHAADIFGCVMLAALLVFLWLVMRRPKRKNSGSGESHRTLMRRIALIFGRISDGIHDIGIGKNLFLSFGASACILILQILSFWFVMAGCGISHSIWAGATVFLIIHLGTAIPNAPSNMGSYQLFCVLGLSLFGVDKTTAAGFSVAVFIILTLPLWVLGLVAINRTGMKLSDIRTRIRTLTKDHHDTEEH
jgi:glycosyltransferase 2 family protein